MDGILTKQLKQIIADCGITQYAIAKQCGIDKSALSRFMRGERSITLESIDAIAGMLNLELRQTKPLAKKSKGA